jgi:chromosome segregation ATPase
MTGEEMERAIEFLLQSQANFETRLTAFDTRLDRLTEEVGHLAEGLQETNKQLRLHADSQAEFIKVVTRYVEKQAQINEGQARINTEFSATQTRIANALDSLATTVQRIAEGRS